MSYTPSTSSAFMGFIKDCVLIFANKGRRKLRDLEKIQDKTFRVQQTLEKSREDMNKALVTVKTEAGVASEERKELERKLSKTEANLLVAYNRGTDAVGDQNILSQECDTLEQELEESRNTEQYLLDLVKATEDKRDLLIQEISEADRIIRVAGARYRTAETILRANAGNIPNNVLAEIEDIRKESIRLQQKNVAISEVAAKDQKRSVKAAISRNEQHACLSIEDKVAKIKAKQLEHKGN